MTGAWTAAWPAEWLAAAAPRSLLAWRGVEAQHIVATMRLVDTLDEQAVLEDLLEASKPPLPPAARQLHYLLGTPFRYRSPLPSRFRRGGAAGVWYGAETLRTAAAEVAYWRWRFITASSGLQGQALLTEHTFFSARVAGLSIDLLQPPWNALREHWTQDSDYGATHALADAARAAGLAWLRYESVRDPGGANVAAFSALALALQEGSAPQTWHCKTTRHTVALVHGQDRHAWTF